MQKMRAIMKRTIITVVGKDTVGIIAKVCTYLAENGINILDISQTIVQGYFNMMMVRTSRFSSSIILLVSFTSNILIIAFVFLSMDISITYRRHFC